MLLQKDYNKTKNLKANVTKRLF